MTPHDRLYALTEKAISTHGAIEERGRFIVHTVAGEVTLCDGGLARLGDVWLGWPSEKVRVLYRRCRTEYIKSRLPLTPPATTAKSPTTFTKDSWWRRLWSSLRPRRALPRARLLKR